MNIAIISDIHDNLANLKIFLRVAKEEKINTIFCLGDVTNQETLDCLASKFKKTIYLIYGNAELYSEQELKKYPNIKYLGRYDTFEFEDLKIGLCHEPSFTRNLLQKDPDLNFIFYGHTHKPWISMKSKATLINPGTLGGVFQKPSFAIFDSETKKIKLKLIHY